MDETGRPVVVITGGSSGIGLATARVFADAGWRIGLIARGEAGLAAAARSLGPGVATAAADVADAEALSQAADRLLGALRAPDAWINCAGNGVYGRLQDVPAAEFTRVTDVSYHGVVHGTRIALARMRPLGRGRIVNVCSAMAFHGLPLMASYAGAKAAVRAFGQSIVAELALERSPIRLVTVFPPAVNTPFFSHAPSHMGWPARPAAPVYQPELVAEGIWRAMWSGRREVTISGTAAAFHLASRLLPAVIAWCVTQMGFERQGTRDAEALRLHAPSLFAPSATLACTRGPFDAGARGWSSRVWLQRQLARLTGGGPAGPGAMRVRPSTAPRRATPVPSAPDHGLLDWEEPPPAA